MRDSIAIIYASIDGHTKTICETLQTVFENQGIRTELHAIEDFDGDLLSYHTLIIGASIRYGKHSEKVTEFILENKEQLNSIQTAFFSVNLVARKANKNSAHTNPYMIKFLKQIEWKADFLEVFAGKLDYRSYSIFDRLMIKLIMLMTKGPTHSKEPIVYTNWERVKAFGERIIQNYNKH